MLADVVCLCKLRNIRVVDQLEDIMYPDDVGLFVYVDDFKISLTERFYLYHNERQLIKNTWGVNDWLTQYVASLCEEVE